MLKDPGKATKAITIDGVVYTSNVHNVVHFISKHQTDRQETSLVDCSTNGGMAGEDMMVIVREKDMLQLMALMVILSKILLFAQWLHKSGLIKAP